MEHFRKLERMYAAAPVNHYFRPTLLIQKGKAEITIQVRSEFHHTAGAMHGVVYFKALDDAAFFAANSLVTDVFVLTARFEIEFLRPVVTGRIYAVGQVTRQDERRIYAVSELMDDSQTIVGRGKGEFAMSRIPLTPEVQYV